MRSTSLIAVVEDDLNTMSCGTQFVPADPFWTNWIDEPNVKKFKSVPTPEAPICPNKSPLCVVARVPGVEMLLFRKPSAPLALPVLEYLKIERPSLVVLLVTMLAAEASEAPPKPDVVSPR